MTTHDLETAEIVRRLSQPGAADRTVDGVSRRYFMKLVGAGGLGAASLVLGSRFGHVREAFAGAPIGANDRILINLILYGGNDGLNMVVPKTSSLYYQQRPSIAIAAEDTLSLSADYGLHPNLPFFKQLWDAGHLAVVQGVGYPNPDLSHFSSMATWMSAKYTAGGATSGWLGRWLDLQPVVSSELALLTLGYTAPLHLIGNTRRGLAVPEDQEMFGSGVESQDLRMYSGLKALSSAPAGRGSLHDMYATMLKAELGAADDVKSVWASALPDGPLSRKMVAAARIVNANVGARVIDVSLDGFDTHEGQPGRYAELMTELNAAVAAFYTELSSEWRDRVAIVSMSEFGRTNFDNDSAGTDHGTVGPMLVIGHGVKGGFKGEASSLAVADRWSRMVYTTDFRRVLGTVLEDWLGADGPAVLGGSYSKLDLFTAPTSGGGVVVPPQAAGQGLSLQAAAKVLDTKTNVGATGALGAGTVTTVTLPGSHTGAWSALLHVTASSGTQNGGYITLWSGGTKPTLSNLNPRAGEVSTGMVVVPMNASGVLSIYNHLAGQHLKIELVGAFNTGTGLKFGAITPARLLDSRSGAKMSGGVVRTIQVSGVSGIPTGARTVLANVTLLSTSTTSAATLWAQGTAQPATKYVQAVPGQTAACSGIFQLGSTGKLNVVHSAGTAHVLVDVYGYFDAAGQAWFVPAAPQRLLDTRSESSRPTRGAAKGVAFNVPAGAVASLVNVTAVKPSGSGYLAATGTAGAAIATSVVNFRTGETRPNAGVVPLTNKTTYIRVGADAVDVLVDWYGTFVTSS